MAKKHIIQQFIMSYTLKSLRQAFKNEVKLHTTITANKVFSLSHISLLISITNAWRVTGYFTSEWSSRIISYMSSSTNNFSGDLLLFAIASPKLSSTETLLVVTSEKHWSLRESKPLNTKSWSQTFRSPANSNLTCSSIIRYCWQMLNIPEKSEGPYSNAHEVNPISNFGLQNFPLHLLYILFAKFFNPQFAKAFFQNWRSNLPK